MSDKPVRRVPCKNPMYQDMEVKAILRRDQSSSSMDAGGTHRKPKWMNAPPSDQRPLIYLSMDVETDGPVPGLYSMLSIGMAAFTLNNEIVWEHEVNLFPLEGANRDRKTMEWWQQDAQQDAWAALMVNRQDPKEALIRLAGEIKKLKKVYRVFPIAWPACFDWMFIQWYMHKFVGENPLGRRAKCADSYAWAISKTFHPNISISTLLAEWEDGRFKHTHRALDDAKEQGAKFINMLRETTQNGMDYRLNRPHRKK